MTTRALFLVGLFACGGDAGTHMIVDGNTGDATGDGQSCGVVLVVDPAMPVIGDHVRVTATVPGGQGVLDFAWLVDGQSNTAYEAADHSSIGFDVPTATFHHVAVTVSGVVSGCDHGDTTFNVGNPNGPIANYRLRVVPPANLAPPQEVIVQVHAGVNSDRPLLLDGGERVQGAIKQGSTLVPAYIRFLPLVGPAFDAVTGTGNFDVHLSLQAHEILVVPANNSLAPKLVARAPSGANTIQVDGGTAWSGTVVDRNGTALNGAQVQLVGDGVPSTLATTAGSGNFTVHHTFGAGAHVTVTVTPPAGLGLPRMTATAIFDQGQPIAVSYAGSPATCDLAGTPVVRGGNNQASAGVTLVGAIATAGSVATGAVNAAASGELHVSTTASGAGTLPSTLVPRAPLSAVVALGATDRAVAPLDTTGGCAAQTIDAPAMIAVAGTTRTFVQTNIGGVLISAVPVGALGMASLVPVETYSANDGSFALSLAAGGHYKLTFTDPGGRGAPLVFDDIVAAGVPDPADLPTALSISGDVAVVGDPNAVENASVQVLCMACTGVAASRPIAQTATDITSHYRVAVPDPGQGL